MSRLESIRAMTAVGRRSDRLVGVAIGSMLFVVATLLTAAPRMLDRAEASSLERAIAEAPAALRRLTVRAIEDFGASPADPLSGPQSVLDTAAESIPDDVQAKYGPARIVVDSNRFVVRAINAVAPASPTLLTLRVHPDLDDHGEIVSGRAAIATDETVDDRRVVEIELSTVTAEVMGLAVGDVFEVVADTGDTVTRRYIGGLPDPFLVRVAGLRRLDDPAEPYWSGDARLHRPTVSDTGFGANFFLFGAIPAEALVDRPFEVNGRGPLAIEQRRDLIGDSVTVDDADELLAGLIALEAATVPLPSPGRPGIAVGLRRVLAGEDDQRTVARGTLAVAGVGVIAVALAVLAQSLQVAFTRRRSWLTIARARGATPVQVVLSTMAEVAALGFVAIVLGTAVARVLAGRSSSALETRLLVGLWVGAIITAGVLAVGEVRRPVTGRRDGTRRLGRWGRAGGAVLVVVALGSTVTFRRRGLDVDGGRIDALVVLLPVLVPLAAVFLARWVLPAVLGAVARFGMRLGPGRLVGVRRAIADPGAGTGLIAVLALALTVAGVGLGVNRSVEEGIDDASWAAVGAPLRIDSRDPDVVTAVRAIPDIELGEYGDNQFRLERGGDVTTGRLINVEIGAVDALTAGTAADLRLPDALRSVDAAGRVPVVAAMRIGGQPLRRGDVVRGTGSLGDVEFVAIQVRPEAFGHERDWVIADRTVFEAVSGRPAPTSSLLFDVPPDRRASVESVAADAGLLVEDRAAVADRQRSDPLVRAVRVGYLGAGVVATLLAMMGVAGLAVVTARERRREVAVLGLLGATRAEVARAVRAELFAPIAAGIVLGTALGAALTALFDGRFDLSPFTAGAPVGFRPDLAGQLLAAGAVAAGALVLTVVLVARIVRVRVDDILRVDGAP